MGIFLSTGDEKKDPKFRYYLNDGLYGSFLNTTQKPVTLIPAFLKVDIISWNRFTIICFFSDVARAFPGVRATHLSLRKKMSKH